jgi:vacuolar-type H+-ATPase subunit H
MSDNAFVGIRYDARQLTSYLSTDPARSFFKLSSVAHINCKQVERTVDDTLKRLLAAEHAASEMVDKAQADGELLIQSASQEARQHEERFAARIPELHASFLEKSDQRATQAVAELERRFQERLTQLREAAETHEETALDAAFEDLLGGSDQA